LCLEHRSLIFGAPVCFCKDHLRTYTDQYCNRPGLPTINCMSYIHCPKCWLCDTASCERISVIITGY